MIYISLLGIALSSLVGCLLSLLAGELQNWISILSLLIGFGGAFAFVRKSTLNLKPAAVSWPVAVLYFLIGIGIYFHSVFLFFKKNDMLYIQDPFNLGDMSFHWGTIRYLAKGAHFWPENPIFFGHRFRYPFGMDFFNAFFENLHVPISTHLPLVTLACLFLTLYMLHVAGGPLLVFAIFFSGGFYNVMQAGPWDLTQIQSGLDFKNLFLTVLLTQRGFLYALPASLLLYHAVKQTFDKNWNPELIEKIALGILWGALGFFHLHTFFFVSLYLGILILWQRKFLVWRWSVVIAAAIGAPFVLNAIWPEAGTTSLIHFSRGWARPEDVDLATYWFKNLGPWLVTVVAGLVIFYRQRNFRVLVPLGLAALLFVVFAHLILAPWDWDNIKLILWCYVFALLALSDWLWTSRSSFVRAAVFVVFFTPGFLLFVRSLPLYSQGITWVSERELNKAETLLSGHNVNAGMAVAPAYEHTALLLGHKLYMGFAGHVWSHGYSYQNREALLDRYFRGDAGAVQDLKRDGVQLIYQGPLEKRREQGWQVPPGLFKLGEAVDHELFKIE